jgi:hypothetical protein
MNRIKLQSRAVEITAEQRFQPLPGWFTWIQNFDGLEGKAFFVVNPHIPTGGKHFSHNGFEGSRIEAAAGLLLKRV